MNWNPLEMPIPHGIKCRPVEEKPKYTGPTAAQLEQLEKARKEAPAKGNKGHSNPQAKLTAEDVIKIREARAAGARACDLAGIYDVDAALISKIALRKAWKHV